MTFAKEEAGAVTVDWVVLTAALVGLGLATLSVVGSGVEDISTDTGDSLRGSVIKTNFAHFSHSALYEAGLASLAAFPDRNRDYATAAEYVENFTARVHNDLQSDPEAVFEELSSFDHQARFDALSALDMDNLTDEDIAAAMQEPANIAGIASTHFDGNRQDLVNHYLLHSQHTLAEQDYILAEAARRGLDPAD